MNKGSVCNKPYIQNNALCSRLGFGSLYQADMSLAYLVFYIQRNIIIPLFTLASRESNSKSLLFLNVIDKIDHLVEKMFSRFGQPEILQLPFTHNITDLHSCSDTNAALYEPARGDV